MLFEPFSHIEREVLLAPEHPGQGPPAGTLALSLSTPLGVIPFVVNSSASDRRHPDDFGKLVPERIAPHQLIAQSQPDSGGLAGADWEAVTSSRLVPVCAGFAASSRPDTTRSLIPSFA